MDHRLSPGRTALLAVCAVLIVALAVAGQFVGLFAAVMTFLAAGWVLRWDEQPAGLAARADGVGHRRG
jgi:hypothetical protein